MTIVRQQTSTLHSGTSATSHPTAFGTNPPAGSKVIVMVQCGGTISSVVDNGTTPRTFTQAATKAGAQGSYIFYADNVTMPGAGAYTVTVNVSAATIVSCIAVAYSGVSTGAPAAVSAGGSATSTSVSSGAVTGAAGSLYAGVFTDRSGLNPETITFTGASPWAERGRVTNGATFWACAFADAIDPSSGAHTATWTLGDSVLWDSVAATWTAAVTSTNTSWGPAGTVTPAGALAVVKGSKLVKSFAGTTTPTGTLSISPSRLGRTKPHWSPPAGYTTFAQVNLTDTPTGRTATLQPGVNYLIKFPSTPLTGPVFINGNGCGHVVAVGGEVNLPDVPRSTLGAAISTTPTNGTVESITLATALSRTPNVGDYLIVDPSGLSEHLRVTAVTDSTHFQVSRGTSWVYGAGGNAPNTHSNGAAVALYEPVGSGTSHDRVGMTITNFYGTLHLEGTWIHAQGDGMALAVRTYTSGMAGPTAGQMIVQLENNRWTDCRAIDKRSTGSTLGDAHTDVWQSWIGPTVARVNYLTGTTETSGFRWEGEFGVSGGDTVLTEIDLRNVDLQGTGTSFDGQQLLAHEPFNNPGPVAKAHMHVENVYLRSGGNPTTGGVYPSQEWWTGVTIGRPGGGDFVATTDVGSGYVSPGYENTSPPPPLPLVQAFWLPVTGGDLQAGTRRIAVNGGDLANVEYRVKGSSFHKQMRRLGAYPYLLHNEGAGANQALDWGVYDAAGNGGGGNVAVYGDGAGTGRPGLGVAAQPLPGETGTVATFDGTSQYEKIGIDLSNTDKFSMIWWDTVPDWTFAGDRVAFEFTINAWATPGSFLIDYISSQISIWGYNHWFSIYAPPTPNQPHLFALSLNRTKAAGQGGIRFWIDGVEQVRTSGSDATVIPANDTTVPAHFANDVLFISARDGFQLFLARTLGPTALFPGRELYTGQPEEAWANAQVAPAAQVTDAAAYGESASAPGALLGQSGDVTIAARQRESIVKYPVAVTGLARNQPVYTFLYGDVVNPAAARVLAPPGTGGIKKHLAAGGIQPIAPAAVAAHASVNAALTKTSSGGGGGGGTCAGWQMNSDSAAFNNAVCADVPIPAFSASQTITVSSASAFNSAVSALAAGQLVNVNNVAFSGETTISKKLTAFAEIHFNSCTFTNSGSTPSVYFHDSAFIRMYGGSVGPSGQHGIYALNNSHCEWYGFYSHDAQGHGVFLFGASGGFFDDCIFAGQAFNDGTNPSAYDPHAEKGTGVHAFLLGDAAGKMNRSKFICWSHDQHFGNPIEFSNAASCTIWELARNATFAAQSQTAANGIAWWDGGSSAMATTSCTFKYIECHQLQGRPIEDGDLSASSPTSSTLTFGRADTCLLNPRVTGNWWGEKHPTIVDAQPLP